MKASAKAPPNSTAYQQFHHRDDPSFAAPDLDDATGHNGWGQITSDQPWGAQGHDSYTGYAWYRKHITLTTAPGCRPDIALFLPHVQDAYEVYWYGLLAGADGKLPPHPVWRYMPPPRTFGLGPIRSGVLAVRVWKSALISFDSGQQGGFTRSPVIGSPLAITTFKETSDNRWLRSHQFVFGLDFLYSLVALFGLLGWLRDRRQAVLFWMGCFAACPPLVDLLLDTRIPFPWAISLGFAQPLFGILSISIWFVLILLLGLDDNPRFMRTIRFLAILEVIVFALDGVLVLTIPMRPASWNLAAQWIDAILTAIFTVLQSLPRLPRRLRRPPAAAAFLRTLAGRHLRLLRRRHSYPAERSCPGHSFHSLDIQQVSLLPLYSSSTRKRDPMPRPSRKPCSCSPSSTPSIASQPTSAATRSRLERGVPKRPRATAAPHSGNAA